MARGSTQILAGSEWGKVKAVSPFFSSCPVFWCQACHRAQSQPAEISTVNKKLHNKLENKQTEPLDQALLEVYTEATVFAGYQRENHLNNY